MSHSDKHLETKTLSQLMDGEWADLNPSDCVKGLCDDDALKGTWERYHLIRDVMRNEPVDMSGSMASRISAALVDEPAYSNVTSIGDLGHKALANTNTSTNANANAAEQALQEAPSQAGSATVIEPQTHRSAPVWRTGMAGLGMAACVAALTVVGLNTWQGSGSNGVSGAVATPSAQAVAQTAVQTNAQTGVQTTVQTASGNLAGATDTAAPNAFSQQVPGAPLPEVQFVSNSGSYWVSRDTTERASSEERLNMFLSQHIEHSPTAVREGMLPYSRLVGYDELRGSTADQ